MMLRHCQPINSAHATHQHAVGPFSAQAHHSFNHRVRRSIIFRDLAGAVDLLSAANFIKEIIQS